MKCCVILFTLFSLFASSSANDECGDAVAIAAGQNVSGSTSNATNDDNATFCETTNTAAGVWYTIVGDGHPLRATTCSNDTYYDTKISVYSGSCGDLECVTGDDDDFSCLANWLFSTVTWDALVGEVYYILVHGFGAQTGDFDLSVFHVDILLDSGTINLENGDLDSFAQGDNDACVNATTATMNSVHLGSTQTATSDSTENCAASNVTYGVWYTIIGTGESITASTCGYSPYDSQISVFTGTCGALVCVDYNDWACNLKSEVTWNSVVGEVYYVLMGGYFGSTGDFELSFTGRPIIEKKELGCKTTGSEPNFFLGGYDVPVGGANPTGMAMVANLWEKNLLGKYQVEISPYATFYPFSPSTSVDGDFAFQEHFGEWRGVGVDGNITENNTDTSDQLSHDEGLYIDLGGLKVKEIIFGLRALFIHNRVAPYGPEGGVIIAYINGELIDSRHFEAYPLPPHPSNDGQRAWRVISDVDFDAIGFVTKSHYATPSPQEGHDFFVEFLDICCPPDASIKGDPHIQTWSGMKYDFHGVCDLVLLQNPDFQGGLGMDIHVRTKQLKQFSYVSSAVLRIGEETLEVMGDIHENLYWINKQPKESLGMGISGYPISYRKVNSKQHEFVVDLRDNKSIVIKTFKKFVRVSFVGATNESFGTSRGLLGSFGSGKMVARDNVTIMEDVNVFGQEWQVLPSEGMLFHKVEGPQAPAKCVIPLSSNLRRRLSESNISEEEAEIACNRVDPEDFDMCVFDVMATGDKEVVGAY